MSVVVSTMTFGTITMVMTETVPTGAGATTTPTATAASGSSGSSSGMTMMMGAEGMMGMMSGFHTGPGDGILASRFTPNTQAAYAGSVIFLILLAILWRVLFALKVLMDRRFIDADRNRRAIVVRGQPTESDKILKEKSGRDSYFIDSNGSREEVRIVKRATRAVIPWRFSQDLPRALMSAVIAAVGYLLMLAIMTYNGGYFGGIIAGIFIGDLIVGRYLAMEEH